MAVFALEAASDRRVGKVAEERALDVEFPVEDHGDVELVRAYPVPEREQRGKTSDASRKRVADDTVDLGRALQKVTVFLVHEHGDLAVREPSSERLEGRHGEERSRDASLGDHEDPLHVAESRAEGYGLGTPEPHEIP